MSTPGKPAIPSDDSEGVPDDPSRRASPDYRPDLRPILLLAGLLVVVFVGWLFLGPLVLPPPSR